MNSKRRVTASILAAGLLATAGLAWAQAPDYTAAGPGSRAQLTDEQARQLDELRGRYEEEMLALERRLAAVETKFDAALGRPEVDTDQIVALRREVRDLEGQLEDLHLRADAEASGVLGVSPTPLGSNMNRLGRGWGPGWCGSGFCAWNDHRSDSTTGHDARRAGGWWRSGEDMGYRGSRTGRRHCH